ncbi:ABC transporter permease [Burkholderia pseudomallei]|uniref:nickel transporter permease n=1 Tax=Burkholderia pseudomallei TaxID=28450 RepID=UPI0000674107|nr:nickel transporter permease [Burkholderia pseudomallei]AIP67642.1 binding--dependent transport system inner membrane component family protein [Burkholderia pseudomallei]AJW90095.1 binding--dependent transport system inner membrane component family protein [Burkholderia pseudomallei 406e]AJX84445.1 binding--dependent transport system inner membrane component family protein [Burkholderia pseudomallei 7894]APD37843.1 D-ala-D-ala transporter subunit [Burkholderia pseudomallei]ARK42309.1 D-ala-D
MNASPDHSRTNPAATTLRAWLLSDAPASRRQATLGLAYRRWRRFAGNPLNLLGLAILAALVAIALVAPFVMPHDPLRQVLADRLLPPGSPSHWLGTDQLGRDILSRLIAGSRLTLGIATLVVAIVVPIGLAIGTTAGYCGGLVDSALMRITDVALAFPKIVLALAFAAALGPGVVNAVVAISITAWPAYARLARAETLRIANADFIHAARLQGASDLRIVLRYVMPLCLSSVIVRATLDMAGIILTVAGLGFLGLGAQPPSPEWGFMVASGRNVLLDAWWVATLPGAAILVVSIAFNLLGDGLRDVFDPRHGA